MEVCDKADSKTLASAAKAWSSVSNRSIDDAIKADAISVSNGKTDSLKQDLIHIWKVSGTPGVYAFTNKLNEQIQAVHPEMNVTLGGVSTGGAMDVNAHSPLCRPQVIKQGEVIGQFSVY